MTDLPVPPPERLPPSPDEAIPTHQVRFLNRRTVVLELEGKWQAQFLGQPTNGEVWRTYVTMVRVE